MLRRKIIADTLILNAGSLAGQVIMFVQSLLVLKMLEPRAYGIWLALNVLLRYATFAHAGIENGIAMRVPYHRGRGDAQRVESITTTAYVAWTGAIAAVAVALSLFAVFTDRFAGDQVFGLYVVALLIVLEQQLSFLSRWETSVYANFRRPALMNVLRQALTCAFVLPLTYAFGLRGLMSGVVCSWTITWIVYMSRSGFKPRFTWSRDAIGEIYRNGFPLFITAIGAVFLETVDRILVGSLLGAAALGYYGLTTLGGQALFGFLRQAGGAISPHIVAEMGKAKDDPRALDKYLRAPTLIFAYLGAALVSALMIGVPTLIRAFLPKYVPGIAAFYCYVPGFFFLGVILTANTIVNLYLIARQKQRITIPIQLAAIAIEGLGVLLAVQFGFGIEGAALSSTAAYAFYGTLILVVAARIVMPEKGERLRFLGAVALPLVYGVAGAGAVIALTNAVALQGVYARLALQALLGFTLWAPVLYLLNRRYAISEIIGRRRKPAAAGA